MRYSIGIHVHQNKPNKYSVSAVATEVMDDLPPKYEERHRWELVKLVPAYAIVQSKSEEKGIKAVLQRIFEKLYVTECIASPELSSPPVTIYISKKYEKIQIPLRRILTDKHWTISLAEQVIPK